MASGSKKVIYAALVGNGLIAITKFIASALTGSSAMLSEGIHSVVDTGNQGLLLLGLKRAKKPPDEEHPFGHGKEVYFWSFIVAILIFAVGAGISIYEGISHILHPSELRNPIINYIVLGLSIVFESVAWTMAYIEFKKFKGKATYFEAIRGAKDPTLFVVLFEDSAAMLGLLVALAGVWLTQVTGDPVFDGAASIVIGLILAGTAIWLAYETKALLIGEAALPATVAGIRDIVGKPDSVEHVNEVLTMHMGPEFVLATVSVDFRDTATAGDIERTVAGLDREIRETYGEVKKVYIEAEPMTRRATATTLASDPDLETE